MATKNNSNGKNSAKKPLSKSNKPIKKPLVKATSKSAEKKGDLIEQKLSSVMEDTLTEEKFTRNTNEVIAKKKANFPWWGLITLILILVFATVLLYEYNKDFRSNFSNLVNSTGLYKIQTDNKTDQNQEKFTMKMTIVSNQADANQKATIDKYLQNIEMNLKNTKVDATWLDKNSNEGKAIIEKVSAKYLPIFTTDESIIKHPQYALFAGALKKIDDTDNIYQFSSEGMEYLTTPEIGDARVIGEDPAKAKVVIIEFASLTCHYCQTMQPILDKIVKAHPNEVSWVVKNFDRGSIDSELEQAAECAADQGKFNQMMDVMYAKQNDFFGTVQDADPKTALYNEIEKSAKEAGANSDKVLACVKAGTHADKVAKSTAQGQEFGVIGTPSFFINKTFLGGALGEAEFIKMVEDELKK